MPARYPTNRRDRQRTFVPPVLPLSPKPAAAPVAPIIPRHDPIPSHQEWWRRQPVPGHGRSWPLAGLRGFARSGLQGWWLSGVGIGFNAAVEHVVGLFPGSAGQGWSLWNYDQICHYSGTFGHVNAGTKCAGFNQGDTWYAIKGSNCGGNGSFPCGDLVYQDAVDGTSPGSLYLNYYQGPSTLGRQFVATRTRWLRRSDAESPAWYFDTDAPAQYRPGFFEAPAISPMLDPFSQPMGVPLPMPAAIPVRVLPEMVPNPVRHPSEQPQVNPRLLPRDRPLRPAPGVTVHPAPEVGAGPTVVFERPPAPDPDTQAAPDLIPRPPRGGSGWWGPGSHARRKPRKGEKERKPNNGFGRGFFMGAVNATTEAADMIEAAHKALPEFAQAPVGSNPAGQLGHVMDYLEDANSDEFGDFTDRFMENWRENSVEDMFYGGMGRAAAKATRGNPLWTSPVGTQAGPWDRQERPRNRKPRDRWRRFGGYNPR